MKALKHILSCMSELESNVCKSKPLWRVKQKKLVEIARFSSENAIVLFIWATLEEYEFSSASDVPM